MPGNHWSPLPLDDILRTLEKGVDPSPPGTPTVDDRGKLELERFPVRVEDQVMECSRLQGLRRERDAVRRAAPVRLAQLDAVPGDAFAPQQLVQRHALFPVLDVPQH